MEGERTQCGSPIMPAGSIDAPPVEASSKGRSPAPLGPRHRAGSVLGGVFKTLEALACRSTVLARVYEELFYSPTLHREMDMAELAAGSKVLVVGSGRLPMTAVHLARHGHDVTAVDNDAAATSAARRFSQRSAAGLNVRFETGDGVDADADGYDAVWITFSASPKQKVLQRALDTMSEGAKAVFRNPRGVVTRFYEPVDEECLGPSAKRSRHLLGKESVMLAKGACDGPFSVGGSQRRITLACLQCGLQGVIAECPEDPVLNALGLRPGKTVVSISRQPFGGPLLASVDGRKVAIDAQVASSILLV